MASEENTVGFPEDGSVVQGSDGTEKVVHDFDDEGNLVGWHKEAV